MSKSILVVEDEYIVSRELQQRLRDLGYEIAGEAITGEQAILNAREKKPDLILMDIKLKGGMDGIEAATIIKRGGNIPIIYLTAFADEKTIERAKLTEPFGYMIKPFDERDLKSTLEIAFYKHEMEQEISNMNEKLKEINASKDIFLSILAHDLRNPFTTILNFSQLLTESIEKKDYDEASDIAGRIYNSAENTFSLLENLLDWSRLQQDNIECMNEDFFLADLVAPCISVFTETAQKKGIRIHNLVPEGILVNADKNMIGTVIRNLLSNAIKFTEEGGSVKLNARCADEVEFFIEDTGIGISDEDAPKLFQIADKFSRRGTQNEKGTGLGLILCFELVKKNGGSLWMEPSRGKGTIFKFTLPRK